MITQQTNISLITHEHPPTPKNDRFSWLTNIIRHPGICNSSVLGLLHNESNAMVWDNNEFDVIKVEICDSYVSDC